MYEHDNDFFNEVNNQAIRANVQEVIVLARRESDNDYTVMIGDTVYASNQTSRQANAIIEFLLNSYKFCKHRITDFTSLCFTASK